MRFNILYLLIVVLFLTSSFSGIGQNSVLSEGNWYKIAVSKDGIYKLSYSDLASLGLDMSSLSCSSIRVFGHGGGMLPTLNSVSRFDDLEENAILVIDQNNNEIFEQGDYILFFGQSPDKWIYNPSDSRFHHHRHLFSRKTYYFITKDLGIGGKRIGSINTQNYNVIVSGFDDFRFHEHDLYNFIKSGSQWYGEKFELINQYDFNFSFPNIITTSPVYIKTNVAARSFSNSAFSLGVNGNNMQQITLDKIKPGSLEDYARLKTHHTTFTTNTSAINISLVYDPPQSGSVGWLDYIEVHARRQLSMIGNQLIFRDINSLNNTSAKFILSNADQNIRIWEISAPTNIKERITSFSGNQLSFNAYVDTLKEYIAFKPSGYLHPELIGQISNQNLHGNDNDVEYVIVSHPDFHSAAIRLANYHQENTGLKTIVVTPQEIYNEFSAGSQDITAIRDFLRMFYKKQNNKLKYLLLFGDASYDPLNRINNNTNFIPSFQSSNSVSPINSYVTDDFFGLLDDHEGNFSSDTFEIDIGIGRLPVKNFNEANNIVDKLVGYHSRSSVGDWRNVVAFVADDGDNNTHVDDAEDLAQIIDTQYPYINIDKIYLDSYYQESTPGGPRSPDAKQALNDRVSKGALLINYTGHAGELGWTKERILGLDQINSWDNKNRLPLFFTASCEFSRFDDPEITSGGESTLLNKDGGAIGLLSTSRVVYSSPNYDLNEAFIKLFLKKENGKFLRLGDLFRRAKDYVGTGLNHRNFILLGDPALTLAYPELGVSTTIIADTLKALDEVTVSGTVIDQYNNDLVNFNGVIYPIVYDKIVKLETLGNESQSISYNSQHNIIFKGKASITNGIFSFSFVMPKDIDYHFGHGKISYYLISNDSMFDGRGVFKDFYIGGSSSEISLDIDGPDVELYINNENFISGGITNEDPILFALLKDISGINTVGNGIGHDIIGILDNKITEPFNLNEYYRSDLDSYQSGHLYYPFYDLPSGHHNIKLKVWDVYNNSTEKIIDFYVTNSEEFSLSNMTNYPNPFINSTDFYFQHNRSGELLEVELEIFNLSGKLIVKMKESIFDNGYIVGPINWNGTASGGQKLQAGIYLYRFNVKSIDGNYVSESQKLIILR